MGGLRDEPRGTGSWRYGLTRWRYRGGRPNRLARLLNWPSTILDATGIILPNRLVTLVVPGRRTGRRISFPLVVADYEGDRSLVAMLGENTNWVRNVRAAGRRITAGQQHGCDRAGRLEVLPPPLRLGVQPRVLYRSRWPWYRRP